MIRVCVWIADFRLRLARRIVPYGWTVVDEIVVSHYQYLRDKPGAGEAR